MHDYYSPAELAKKFRVTTQTVARWADDGEFTFEKVGRNRVYSKASVESFLRRREEKHGVLNLS